ncbi:EF-hand domain-containing protein [Stieleria varia]|uniref:EF hand n=1 Tax=Stieleria varia TaxID=2528005 RepID=A0A5C6ATT9_9BACT|nr:EF-hand domain-containing protein [Stieleria varia]TWU02432.1 EF hand [Stieleria varia]
MTKSQHSLRFSILSILLACLCVPADAQFGGPPGGDRGSRGGPPFGGGGPSFGGGGDRGGRGGSPFGGGPPQFGGGGDRGSRGGPPGGDRGSRGGGGFDPSGFLSRLDTNGNGILDPDEQQGPAQFMITRMQQSDPSIVPGKPISLKKMTESFEKMRGDRGGPSSPSSNGDEGLEVELLVPGFGVPTETTPLMGFGPAAEMMAVEITDEDRKEASERMARYDRNRDGFLSKDELSSRLAGNPMDFDRNKDGRLSVNELAIRYARRRETAETARQDDRRRTRDRGDSVETEMPDVYNGRQSYRVMSAEKEIEGLPGFFIDKDVNKDGQIEMAEFATEWNAELVAEFSKSDLNSDGIITASEVILALDQPADSGSSMTSSSDASRSSDSERSSSSSAAAPSGPIDEKYKKYAERLISRYDTNKNGELTASEWKPMLMSPADADTNRDGKITLDEYAIWMQVRATKK